MVGDDMAVDTIGLRSPFILEDLALKIEQECVKRQGLDMKTGELLYSITTGSLEGSYDSRISVKVEREAWARGQGIGKTAKVSSEPYLYVECSVHKLLFGHNVYGGTCDFRSSAHFLVELLENTFDVRLPDADYWTVRRIDNAEVYELPSYDVVQEYFKGLNASDYPRRSVNRYGLTGVYAHGSTTALKFYHKGPEFYKHDRKRLLKHLDSSKIFELQELAHRIIRVEVEIKTKKLEYDFGNPPMVKDITEEYISSVLDREVTRFLKEGAHEMKIVRDAHEVEKRLYSVYDSRLAGILLGTWFKLATLGEDSVKKSLPKQTFYRQRNQLKEAGVSWLGTDVVLKKTSLIPEGFSPVRTDPRRLVGEHPVVTEKLAHIRAKLAERDAQKQVLLA